MSSWHSLISSALVGTERQPLDPAALPPIVQPLLQGIDPADRERALLKCAAVAAVTQMAGFHAPVQAAAPNAPAEPETLPCCSRMAGGILASLLASAKSDLIDEWLDLAARRGVRIPPEHLPGALDYGAKRSGEAVAALVGNRGAWLAAQNPDWAYAARSSGESAAEADPAALSHRWETSDEPERLDLLRDLVLRDRVEARRLIESTWQEDAPQQRAAFLARLRSGLCADDEPLLERALEDKRKEVRQAAIDLLAALPGSAFGRRQFERARECLSLRKDLLGSEVIGVSLRQTWDAALVRDGIEQKPSRNGGYGERAWWLRQILGFAPVALWPAELDRTPAQLVEAADRNDEWRSLLLAGWAEAAGRTGDAAWLAAIQGAMLRRSEPIKDGAFPLRVDLSAVPDSEVDALLDLALTQPFAARSEVALELLRQRSSAWSSSMARQVFRIALSDVCRTGTRTQSVWWAGELIQLVGRRSPPQLVEELAEQWERARANPEAKFDKRWETCFELLRFRLQMRQAFDEEAG